VQLVVIDALYQWCLASDLSWTRLQSPASCG
jgi:hypothetical protein